MVEAEAFPAAHPQKAVGQREVIGVAAEDTEYVRTGFAHAQAQSTFNPALDILAE